MHNSFNIIAETAFSHEGDPEYLFAQIKAAKKGNADYVKFQILLDAGSSYVPDHPMLEKVKRWQFSAEMWHKAFEYSKAEGLKVLVLPIDVSATQFCMGQKELVDAFEIHSICFNEYHLLTSISQYKGKLFLGIGGRLPEEITYAIQTIGVPSERTILMYGIQAFPTPITDTHLSKIGAYRARFGCDVGYADHTQYESDIFHTLNDYAFVQGARYFEKHIVVAKGEKRVDYESAIDSSDFLMMRKRLEALVTILGDADVSRLREQDITYRNREKKIVAKRDIPAGTVIGLDDLMYALTQENSEIAQRDIRTLLDKCAIRLIRKHSVIHLKDLQL